MFTIAYGQNFLGVFYCLNVIFQGACVLINFSNVWLFVTLWTVACQASLSTGFSRQEYWIGLPCPPPGNLPNSGIKPMSLTSPALAEQNTTGRWAPVMCATSRLGCCTMPPASSEWKQRTLRLQWRMESLDGRKHGFPESECGEKITCQRGILFCGWKIKLF